MVMLIYESIFKIIATVNDIVFNKKPVIYNVFKKEKKNNNNKKENHSVRFSPPPFLAINRKKDRKRKGTN